MGERGGLLRGRGLVTSSVKAQQSGVFPLMLHTLHVKRAEGGLLLSTTLVKVKVTNESE